MNHQLVMHESDLANGSDQDGLIELLPDIAYKLSLTSNIVFVGAPHQPGWALIDTGITGFSARIQRAASSRFGDHPPACIVLTHAHFEQTGNLLPLLAHWDVPVYAHNLECPYLDGTAAYPKADPMVGGGLMSLLSVFHPRGPTDISKKLRALPCDGAIPDMPKWRALHTPGHTVGHIALWREEDRTLISGDALITTNSEAALAFARQEPEIHGPPQYSTLNWSAACASVRKLASLDPNLVIASHGKPMQGDATREAMHQLARNFDQLARPRHGHFLAHPGRATDGTAYVKTSEH